MKPSLGLILLLALMSLTAAPSFGQKPGFAEGGFSKGFERGANARSQSTQSSKDQYELSERCGKAAREWFEAKWGPSGTVKTKEGVIQGDFRNHYNLKRNACIVLLTVDTLNTKDSTTIHNEILFDLNENSNLGEFLSFDNKAPGKCAVRDARCTDKGQWDVLIKPYLEQ